MPPRKDAAEVSEEGAPAPAATPVHAPELPVYTLEDVSKHDTEGDCWVAIDGFVANITDYLNQHPGSKEQLLEVAGALPAAFGPACSTHISPNLSVE